MNGHSQTVDCSAHVWHGREGKESLMTQMCQVHSAAGLAGKSFFGSALTGTVYTQTCSET